MTPEDITIAITVFDRRNYIEQAVATALAQTLSVRVMVVEDCGPDPTLQSFVLSKFGRRVSYHRNARRRGLFDNWNACIDLCQTRWLCICHDDDFLESGYVEAMIELAAHMPDKGLYFGKWNVVDAQGRVICPGVEPEQPRWESMDLAAASLVNSVYFPCQIFRADYAKALGGFLATSSFTGDWDMWIRLAAEHGAAQTSRVIGNSRSHDTLGRGTTRVERNGKMYALINVQCKKNLAHLRQQGRAIRFDRGAALRGSPMSSRWLLKRASGWSDRLLRYNSGLFLQSQSPSLAHFLLKTAARLIGPGFIRSASWFWLRLSSEAQWNSGAGR